ncbi:EamA family transporter [Paenibacillus agricola]|nr:EamA family transporter [Paenibacillus agricola]
MKIGGNGSYFQIEKWVFDVKIDLYLIMGMCLYIISFLMYAYIISKNDLSYIIAVLGAAVTIISILVGIFVFHEQINVYKVIGILIIIVGVVLVNIKT